MYKRIKFNNFFAAVSKVIVADKRITKQSFRNQSLIESNRFAVRVTREMNGREKNCPIYPFTAAY